MLPSFRDRSVSPPWWNVVLTLLFSKTLLSMGLVSFFHSWVVPGWDVETQLIFMFWSCNLQLCWMCLLAQIASFWILWGFLYMETCHLQIEIDTSPFLIWVSLISFSYLIALVRTTLFSFEHPLCCADSGQKLSVFHHRIWYELRAFHKRFCHAEEIPLCSQFSERGHVILPNPFSASLVLVTDFFF